MKISIVTISYNQAKFLERAIKSVVGQDYEDIEYIIVDPGSTDGSREIIEKYRDRIDKIIFEPDDGPADGLNKGFSYATGDVCGYINSDDAYLPGALSYVDSFFHAHPGIDVMYGHTIIMDEQDRKLRNGYSDPFSLIGYAYGAVVVMQQSTFFRSDIFKKTQGFNISNKTSWDGELFVDMCLKGARFALTNYFLSGFRLHSESITSSKKLDDGIKAYSKVIFKKIIGRDMKLRDSLLSIMFRLLKHVRNPRALYERLSKGPIYGRDTRR